MKPNDKKILIAFLAALTHLNEPLPADIQAKLNEIGKALAVDPTNLGNLDVIAESYQPLDEAYQKELKILDSKVGERNKHKSRRPLPKELNKELSNVVIVGTETFSSNDSVSTAKQAVNPTILKQIW
ncbi:MAG: hypothetical protein KME49_02680 [Brasilonema octagenarum HA4186-MV1]|jgi:hypothetical protein|nr:hypothetical protein [Brasilonema octagenarum HA4186-MV1]